jgi:hypothetical protein
MPDVLDLAGLGLYWPLPLPGEDFLHSFVLQRCGDGREPRESTLMLERLEGRLSNEMSATLFERFC